MTRTGEPTPPPVATSGPTEESSAKGRTLLRYEAVHALVLQLIEERHLAPGDRLPSSRELAEMAGVSMISVRRALDDLERGGKIRRHQGLGTFVARERIVTEPTRSGELLATLTSRQADPELTTELLGITVGLPSPSIARALGIGVGQPVWEVTRRRLVHGQPVILETAALPVHLVPTLDEEWLARGDSMYRLLAERFDLVDDYEEQYLEVAVPTVAECEALGLSPREQVVRIRGVSFSTERAPFDCYEQTYPAREFVFYVSGSTNRHLVQPPGGRDWSITPLVPQTGMSPKRRTRPGAPRTFTTRTAGGGRAAPPGGSPDLGTPPPEPA